MPGLMGKKTIILINNMRRHLFMLFCLLMVSSVSWADDCAKLGFKGKVKEVSYSSLRGSNVPSTFGFDENGELDYIGIVCQGIFHTYWLDPKANGYTGSDSYGQEVTVTMGKNGISKIVYPDAPYDWYTVLYTYDKNGHVSKVKVTKSWEEIKQDYNVGSASINTNGAEHWLQKIAEATASGNMAAVIKYKKKYEDAVKGASVSVKQGGFTTKKIKKSESYEITYSYNQFDEVGNWILRTSRRDGGEPSTERAQWTYDEDFLAQFLWDKHIAPTMYVASIESFYNSTKSEKYEELAQKEWNSRIFDVIESKYNNSLDKYFDVLRKPIALEDSRLKAHNYIGEQMYQSCVLLERDYKKVIQLADMHQDSIPVFLEDYRKKILERAETLRQDSISYLTNLADTCLVQKSYAECSKAARTLLGIEPSSQKAVEYAAESEYQLLQERVAAGKAVEEDYVSYLDLNPGSKYTRDVQNARALYACSLFGKTTDDKEFMRVRALPMDYNIYKIVSKKSDRQSYLNERGKFFHAGISGFGSLDEGFCGYGGGVSMRFGWLLAWVNGFADVQYEHLDNMTSKSKLNGCILKGDRLNVPFGLRLNVVRNPGFATFVSVGAQYSMPLGAKVAGTLGEESYKISDKNIFNKNNIIPRVGFGIATTHFELELYGLYETGKGVVNRSYVEGNTEYMNILDPVVVDKQFKSKIHGGLTFRLLFGK